MSGVKAFISYSHRDERFRQNLESHLSILRRLGVIDVWHDRVIKPGSELDDSIDTNLEQSELVILLISADFLASDYC